MLQQQGRNGAAKPTNGGMRARWRHSRAILKEGVEAALRASPEVLENCKPKTNYGALVRGLVLEAAKCKATPLKTVMSLIDWEPRDDEDDVEELDDSQRDWSADGVWETMPEAEPASEPAEQEEDGAAKKELKRRITRLIEAGQHEHAARIMDAIRSGYDPAHHPISTA